MSTQNFVSMLAKVGINAEVVDARDGEIDVRLTAGQFEKLSAVLPGTVYLKVSKGKIIASVFLIDLEKAIEENAKAPRVAPNVAIYSKMVYTIDAKDTTNIVTEAEWSSDHQRGYIAVNGQNMPVFVGKAEQYYEAPEDAETEWNPERPVFVLTLKVERIDEDDEDEILLTSYGFTNLIRRVCSLRKHVL